MLPVLYRVFLLLPALICWACHNNARTHHPAETEAPSLVSGAGTEASSPYLTTGPEGDVILCWTEELPETQKYVLKFAGYNQEREVFGRAVTVAPSKGTRPHPESMNKVAFKSNGTAVAVYAKSHPTEENRFAGSLFYAQSFDQGKTWTKERYLHSDTLATYGRGFFDVATLPDGEIGAIWLDGRFGDADTGSALFFAKTGKGRTAGFGRDIQIGESTCECCRTELYVSRSGRIHVAYRDIIDERIRDMVYQWSGDQGETFSVPQRISRDNWEIDGCPHTGPSLAGNEEGLHALWFTAGGGTGVYHSFLGKSEPSFGVRNKVSESARHPQLAALPDGRMAAVWEEALPEDSKGSGHHGGHSGQGHRGGAGSGIILQIFGNRTIFQTRRISAPGVNASHPVLAVLDEGTVLVAWVQMKAGQSGIFYKQVDLTE